MKMNWVKYKPEKYILRWRLMKDRKTLAEVWKQSCGRWFGIDIKGDLKMYGTNSHNAFSRARKPK